MTTRDVAGGAPPCPACRSPRATRALTKGELIYNQCADCRLRFLVTEANANFRQRLQDFEPSYRQYLGGSQSDVENLDATIDWIERHAAKRSSLRVLDVGAGSGKFVRHLRARRSWQVTALEPSSALFAGFDLASLGLVNQTLPEFARDNPLTTFDVVTVLDVVEHISDPLEFATSLRAVTTLGGLVFISTPDAGSTLAAIMGRRWHHYNAYHHSLFNGPALDGLARRAGFMSVERRHVGRRYSTTYIQRYVCDFIGWRVWPLYFDAAITLNLFDVISTVWRRTE